MLQGLLPNSACAAAAHAAMQHLGLLSRQYIPALLPSPTSTFRRADPGLAWHLMVCSPPRLVQQRRDLLPADWLPLRLQLQLLTVMLLGSLQQHTYLLASLQVTNYVIERVAAMRKQHPGTYTNITALRTNAMRYLPYFFAKGQLTKLFFLFPVGRGSGVQCSQGCVGTDLQCCPQCSQALLGPGCNFLCSEGRFVAPCCCVTWSCELCKQGWPSKRCSFAYVQAMRSVLVRKGSAVLHLFKQSKPVLCCRTPTSRRPITGVASSRPPCWLSMRIAWLLGACCTPSRTCMTSQSGCARSWMRIPCLRGGLSSCAAGAMLPDERALLILCCYLWACPCRKQMHA